MTVTFEQILRQANVRMSPKNPAYLAKDCRTCEATSRLIVAIRAALDNGASDTARQEGEKAKLARENSVLAGKLADAERKVAEAEKIAITRGLEATELPEATRKRIMCTNGS